MENRKSGISIGFVYEKHSESRQNAVQSDHDQSDIRPSCKYGQVESVLNFTEWRKSLTLALIKVVKPDGKNDVENRNNENCHWNEYLNAESYEELFLETIRSLWLGDGVEKVPRDPNDKEVCLRQNYNDHDCQAENRDRVVHGKDEESRTIQDFGRKAGNFLQVEKRLERNQKWNVYPPAA